MILISEFVYLDIFLTLCDLQDDIREHGVVILQFLAEKNPFFEVHLLQDIISDLLENSPQLVLSLAFNKTPIQVTWTGYQVVIEELSSFGFSETQSDFLISHEFITNKLLHDSETVFLPIGWILDIRNNGPELVQSIYL